MDYHYDIAIVGLGCAGSHVLIQMLDHPEMKDKKIIVFDDFQADSLEKTWSFWEKGAGKWDSLLLDRWTQGKFQTSQVEIDLGLNPYSYKTIKSKGVIAFAKAKLQQNPNATFVDARVDRIEESKVAAIHTNKGVFKSKLVLDSRVSPEFYKDTEAITLRQHFLGWHLRTEQEVFDPERFVMMDYRLMDPGTTSFMYILPYSETEALVEFTYFSPDLVADQVYENYLNQYIDTYLNATDYSIVQTEQGVIPMTTYRFEKHHTSFVHKIGTAGGWVKSSTGYSFKLSEKRATQLISNYIKGRDLDHGMQKKRFRFYDDIMLDVLHQHNNRGHLLFENLYSNNPIARIFSFLDEESNFLQELKIMLPLTSLPFIKSFFKKLF
ncbi:lycopene cyclase family protein [Nonlabens marinus]|uniref:Lycopene beta cyclase n=1 Tax=Nonlabens marinus S1-08 TaxID=1454201 RepID=W8VVS0_9FLAO|nr:lycopene cyclase family protein [Nonlabens marinus]BAO54132.1 lycopene beta cyclase [Nonlabens marinus S1-08]